MRVKAVDIAKELGLSKATVSLALNDKPGVNPKTKQEILECKERLKHGITDDHMQMGTGGGYVIKIIVVTRNLKVAVGAELDLWTDVNAIFDVVAKGWGCTLEISYFDIRKDSPVKLAGECSQEKVGGVILFGTELYPGDMPLFGDIHKPMVVYDNDPGSSKYSSVVVDNSAGVKKAVDYLMKQGKKNIIYLSRNVRIYNYEERRSGFEAALWEYNISFIKEDMMVCLGEKIETIYQNMKEYLDTHGLPDAFIMESYHLSIGCIRAFREKGIRIPLDVSIIGIDELPDYMTGEHQLTTIRIPHTERAKLVMMLLYHEMHDSSSIKSKIVTDCRLIEGSTA